MVRRPPGTTRTDTPLPDTALFRSRYNLPDEITLNHMDDHGWLALPGPKAVDALARMGLTPLQPGWPAVSELVFMQVSPYDWNGVPVSVSRSGYTGEDGFEISQIGRASYRERVCQYV